jgi:MFS family permease
MLTVFVVVYGFAMGGNATLWATVVAGCFGRLHYGAIAGWMTPFIVFIQALSIPLAGAVRDASGTYEPAFAAIIGLTLVAMVCIAGLDYAACRAGARRRRRCLTTARRDPSSSGSFWAGVAPPAAACGRRLVHTGGTTHG